MDNNNFDDAYGSFGVTAYVYRGKWADGREKSVYIDDKEAVGENGEYDFSPSVFWPGKEFNMAFFAYAPYGAIDPDGTDEDGFPEFRYTVPEKIEDQKDLLAWWGTDYSCSSSGMAGADAVDIDFQHLCTAVKFKMGNGENLQKNIKSISLKGVYREGTWSAADADGWNGGHWTLDSGTGDFSVDVASSGGYEDGTEITIGEKVFMMLPQTLPDGAEIEVVYNDGSSDQTLTASIAGTDWGQGEMVVYRISHEDIVRVPELDVTWSYIWASANQTTDKNFTVSSYWTEFKDGQETGNTGPVPWHLEYQDESGNWIRIDESTLMPNRWVKFAKVSGEGGTDAERIGVTVYSQRESADPDPDHWSLQNEALMKLAPLSGIHDLSVSKNGSVSTANCYIVNAPGTYRLPLVYGNAVKDGKTNSSAYISTLKPEDARQERVLTHFVDYKDQPIESPLIEGATDAALLWIDDNMCGGISVNPLADGSIMLDGSATPVKYLEFTVNAPMRQSNAVVAVKDSEGTTIWSWHIWMTDYVLGEDIKTVQNYAGKQYEFMPVNIGWVDSQTSTYPERKVSLRVVQDIEEGEIFSNNMGITQYATTEILVGNGATYQFGKKDPTPGNEFLVREGNVTALDFHNESNDGRNSYGPHPFTVIQRNAASLGESISHPEIGFFSADGYYSWYGTSYIPINLWDVNNDEDNSDGYSSLDFSVTKSVYDPSPVGFTVAPYDAFTGFVTDPVGETMQGGHNSSDKLDEYNSNFGMYFHCAPSGAGGTIFFPWSKMRGNNGRYGGSTGSSNVYWIASPKYSSNYESYGYVFSFSYSGIVHATAHGAGPSAGYNQAVSVRPVRETD